MKENMKKKIVYIANYVENPILIIVCFILTIMIAFNVALLVDAFLHPDRPPSVFGYAPLVMGETDSNLGLEENTFLLASKKQAIGINNLVAYRYWDLSLLGRIDNVEGNNGFINAWGETITINDNDLIGKIIYTNLPLGQFLMFTQTRIGMLIFLIIPLILIVVMQEHWFTRKRTKEILPKNQIMAEIVPTENQIFYDALLEELKQNSLNKANEPIKNISHRERRKELWKRQRKNRFGE